MKIRALSSRGLWHYSSGLCPTPPTRDGDATAGAPVAKRAHASATPRAPTPRTSATSALLGTVGTTARLGMAPALLAASAAACCAAAVCHIASVSARAGERGGSEPIPYWLLRIGVGRTASEGRGAEPRGNVQVLVRSSRVRTWSRVVGQPATANRRRPTRPSTLHPRPRAHGDTLTEDTRHARPRARPPRVQGALSPD